MCIKAEKHEHCNRRQWSFLIKTYIIIENTMLWEELCNGNSPSIPCMEMHSFIHMYLKCVQEVFLFCLSHVLTGRTTVMYVEDLRLTCWRGGIGVTIQKYPNTWAQMNARKIGIILLFTSNMFVIGVYPKWKWNH